MPIEIRQITIKAEIGSEIGASGAGAPAAPSEGAGFEEVVNEAVERVLEILKKQQER